MEPSRKARIVPIPILTDNFAYLLVDNSTKQAAIVDAGPDVEPILSAVEKEGVKVTTILTTHHHWDHADGNKKVLEKLGNLEVIGGDDRIPGLTRKVVDGDVVRLGELHISCRFTPCHTKGHTLYHVDDALFTGDTLFIGGCGKFMEGTGEQMNYALNDVIAKYDPSTELWVGHEYTVANLKFALSIEPENKDVIEKLAWATKQREADKATIPSCVGEELKFNPFMRVKVEGVKSKVGSIQDSDAETMTKLRNAKNDFKAQL